jgi:hypothetical protein
MEFFVSFLSVRSKYFSHHPVLKHPQQIFLLRVRDHVLRPHTWDKIVVFI